MKDETIDHMAAQLQTLNKAHFEEPMVLPKYFWQQAAVLALDAFAEAASWDDWDELEENKP